jgi:hypothetical protein
MLFRPSQPLDRGMNILRAVWCLSRDLTNPDFRPALSGWKDEPMSWALTIERPAAD